MRNLPFLELKEVPAPIYDSNNEEARHAKAIQEECQRYLDILFALTGEVLLNEYNASPQGQQEVA